MRLGPLALVPLALVGTIMLGACGRVGTLEQPAPLYGAKAKADYQRRKAAEAEETKTAKDSGEPELLPPEAPAGAPGAAPPANGQPGPGPHGPGSPGPGSPGH